MPVLQTAGDTLLLTGEEAENIEPNTSVEVSGTVSGEEMAVTSTEVLGRAPVTALPTSGNVRTLVMLATWPGLARDDVTQASATQQMFGDTKDWYRNASYSAVSMSGDVTPWLSIAGPAGNRCYSDHLALMQQAKNAAVAAGYVLSAVRQLRRLLPLRGQPHRQRLRLVLGLGLRRLDRRLDQRLHGPPDHRARAGPQLRAVPQPLLLCPDGGVGGADCDFSDYGDAYDAMGSSGYVGNFNASQKSVLGWFGGRSVDLSAGGTATLAPMDQQSAGIRGASVTVSRTRTYWLEYRQPTGADAWLPEEGTDGVLVHLRDDTLLHAAEPTLYYRDTGAALLDVRPGDGVDVWSATLPSGQSWTTPEGVTISVGAVTATGAQVTVADGVQPPGAPQAVHATAGSGLATVTWQAPASEGGSPIVSYRVTASPGGKGVTVSPSARTATVTGLATGWYTFSVAATNGQGERAGDRVQPTSGSPTGSGPTVDGAHPRRRRPGRSGWAAW